MSSIIQVTTVHYPESDGKPMAETDVHRDEMFRQIDLLKRFFAGQQVYVSGNLFLYYERGKPKSSVAPDVFVVKDLAPGDRRVYKLWVERKPPNVVIEVTSRKTKKKDTVTKPAVYAQLGVKEYFVFDPTQDYLDPPLRGYRLMVDEYEQLAADAEERLISEELGVRLQAEQGHLMFHRLDTGERLLTNEEACRAAEAEVARLREELRRRSTS